MLLTEARIEQKRGAGRSGARSSGGSRVAFGEGSKEGLSRLRISTGPCVVTLRS